jgi:hypothetical protein
LVHSKKIFQVFINYNDNSFLDNQGFAPFGKVVPLLSQALFLSCGSSQVTTGMSVVRELYSGYGDSAPSGSGPDQSLVQVMNVFDCFSACFFMPFQTEGNAYLKHSFPKVLNTFNRVVLTARPILTH